MAALSSGRPSLRERAYLLLEELLAPEGQQFPPLEVGVLVLLERANVADLHRGIVSHAIVERRFSVVVLEKGFEARIRLLGIRSGAEPRRLTDDRF